MAAVVIDMGGPFMFGADGWHLVPGHFAERHGLIVIIALGESIVAIGVGASDALPFDVIVSAVVGIALAAGLWWAYFDVAALIAARRLAQTPPGREQNELARDAYSYLHFPMVAGIVLVALAMERTIAHVDDPLGSVATVALAGGVAVYLLAHVAFKYRAIRTLSGPRLTTAVILGLLVPALRELPALGAVAVVTGVLIALIAYETVRFADLRDRERHQLEDDPSPD
jgi:low temperature requirement protein LtrA